MDMDPTLLDAARRMDEEALVKIFDLCSPALYRYALRMCGDPILADHIVGDVFARLLEQLSAGNGPTTNLRAYLYEAAYHQIVDEVRFSQHQVSLDVALSVRGDTQFSLEDKLLFRQISHAIRYELTDDQRHVIVLRFLEGFSLRETAAILGKKIGHVKVIQTRALTKLRTSIEEKGIKKPRPSLRLRRISKALGL
jgi:RNA polymerase sigma-70 factor (ECF subfamily)